MHVKAIRLQNYRSFGDVGARLSLEHQFIGITGVNNAGKSSLVRSLWELRPLIGFYAGVAANTQPFNNLLNASGHRDSLIQPQLIGGERIQSIYSDKAPRVTIELAGETAPQDFEIASVSFTFAPDVHRMSLKLVSGREFDELTNIGYRQLRSDMVLTTGVSPRSVDNVLFDWDSARAALSSLADSLYVGPFRNAINIGGSSYYDLTVGRDFITQFNNFKTGPDASQNESVYLLLKELAEIFGYEQLEVNAAPSSESLNIMVDGRSFRGSELGAGIMQFIVVAANVLVKRPNILLIDEPELNLHASLQLKFLMLLAKYVRGPVVFATHSLGLARSAADELFVVTRDADGVSQLRPYLAVPNLSSVLGELGYGGLHDATYKVVLLVEGVTDVKVFQELLVMYGIRNEVAIVNLGGDAMVKGGRGDELAQLRVLAHHVFAVVDSERTSAGARPTQKRLDFEQSCKQQGIKCLLTQRRSTENYLNQSVARSIMGSSSSAQLFGEYGLPKDYGSWNWSKEKNWQIASRMRRSELDSTDLGVFLDEVARTALSAD